MPDNIKTEAELAQEIKIANYYELINPVLDCIDFISLQQAPTIFAQLDIELAIFHTSSTLGIDPENKIDLLSSVKELLDPENMYASKEDLPDLHIVILKRLNQFLRQIRNWTQQELNDYITQQHLLRTQRINNSNISTAILQQHMAFRANALTAEELILIDIFKIDPRINIDATRICIATSKIEQLSLEVSDVAQTILLQTAFETLLISQLKYTQKEVNNLKLDPSNYQQYLAQLKLISSNIRSIFNSYKLEPSTFIALDEASKSYLLFNPKITIQILDRVESSQNDFFIGDQINDLNMIDFLQTDLPELNFCLQCLSYIEQINSIISPNADDEPIKQLYFTNLRPGNSQQITQKAIQFINTNMETDYQPEYVGHENLTTLLVHAVRITMRNRISLSNLSMISYEIKNNLLQNPSPVLDLVCQMGLDLGYLSNKPYHEILYIYLNRIKIIEVIKLSAVNLNTLLTLQHKTLVNILDHKSMIIDFCKNTHLNLNTLLRASKELLEYIFNDFKTLQTLTQLYEHYFVNLSEVFKLPLAEFVSLIIEPQQAATLHIARTSGSADQILLADLALYVESQLQSIRSLANGMHMVNLTKLRDHPRHFIANLKANGLPFVICSSLYDVLHAINSKVCESYMSYFQNTGTKSLPKTFSYNHDSLALHSDPSLNKEIVSMLDTYISQAQDELARAYIGLDSFIQNSAIDFAPNILKHDLLFLQAEYTTNQLDEACKLIQDLYQKLKKSLSLISRDSMSAKHLCVILSLANCNAANRIISTKPNNTKLLTFAKETIRNLAGYLHKTCLVYADTAESHHVKIGSIATQSNTPRY